MPANITSTTTIIMFMRRVGRVVAAIAAFGSVISRFCISRYPMCGCCARESQSTAFMYLRVREARREGRDGGTSIARAVQAASRRISSARCSSPRTPVLGPRGHRPGEIKKSLEADWERGR
jgi:hypothetical protein